MLTLQVLGTATHMTSYDISQVETYLKEVHCWPLKKMNCQFNFNLGNIYVGDILTL